MSRSLVAGFFLTSVLAAAPVPKEDDAARMRRIYGSAHDPDQGAAFKPSGDTLRITLPQERRLLDAWNKIANAPRVWRDVRGDFTVSARVSFPVREKVPPRHIQGEDACAGGGLVVWAEPSHGRGTTPGRSR